MPRSADRGLTVIAGAPLRVAVLSGPRDGLARRLVKRMTAQGAHGRIVRLADCSFDTSKPSGIAIPGFGRDLPDGVFVRMVPGGSFEAVTKRLGVLHALRELGVPVWNDARAIERCVDKSQTTFLLQRAGLPVPPTWTLEDRDAAAALVRREARRGPLVLKPLFGSQGRGLKLIRTEADLPAPDDVQGTYHLQRFLGVETAAGFRDFRVFVAGGQVLAAMIRHGETWITNVKQGGRPEALVGDRELEQLAVKAAHAVGADFCGVDLLRDRAGSPYVLEVNSMPAWTGLQKVADIDIASALAAAFLDAVGERRRARRSA